MRLNKFIALSTGMSRRAADNAISDGRVLINDKPVELGQRIEPGQDTVTLDRQPITPAVNTTIMFNKPVGYVCSRDGQGSRTIYELLPEKYHNLKTVGRLDKYSSGLLLLTNDGTLAYDLTHPSFEKEKHYDIALDQKLTEQDYATITKTGVKLEDGLSKFKLGSVPGDRTSWKVIMTEGRNRQIRRTFEALGYRVEKLHRTHFGPYALGTLSNGEIQVR